MLIGDLSLWFALQLPLTQRETRRQVRLPSSIVRLLRACGLSRASVALLIIQSLIIALIPIMPHSRSGSVPARRRHRLLALNPNVVSSPPCFLQHLMWHPRAIDATEQRLEGLRLAAEPAGPAQLQSSAAASLPNLPSGVLALLAAHLAQRDKLCLAATCRRLLQRSGEFWHGATIAAADLWAPKALASFQRWLAARRPAAAALRCAPLGGEGCSINDFEPGLELPLPPSVCGLWWDRAPALAMSRTPNPSGSACWQLFTPSACHCPSPPQSPRWLMWSCCGRVWKCTSCRESLCTRS